MRTKTSLPNSLAHARSSWSERELGYTRRLHTATVWPAVVQLLVWISRLGNGPLWYGLIMLLPWVGGSNGTACAIRMFVMGAGNLVVYKALKRCFARARPYVNCPDIHAGTRSLDEYSFPSGHTLHAIAFSVVLCAYYPAMAWVLWPFTVLLAVSRVVLGLHYPSDVLAGIVIGVIGSHIALGFL